MGWKNVKEHYRIEHIVCVREGKICVGSSYIADLIAINAEGAIVKRYDGHNEDVARYQREMDANPAKLRDLVTSPDSFTASLPVFTFENGVVLEKRCEQLGWPNLTHEGQLMYENMFSPDRAKAECWAKEDAESHLGWAMRRLADAESKIAECRLDVAEAQSHLNRINATLGVAQPATREHELKTWPHHFEAIAKGEKTFEIRRNDRNFAVGDVLVLREFEPEAQRYTGRSLRVAITYLTDFAQQPEMVVLAIRAA